VNNVAALKARPAPLFRLRPRRTPWKLHCAQAARRYVCPVTAPALLQLSEMRRGGSQRAFRRWLSEYLTIARNT